MVGWLFSIITQDAANKAVYLFLLSGILSGTTSLHLAARLRISLLPFPLYIIVAHY